MKRLLSTLAAMPALTAVPILAQTVAPGPVKFEVQTGLLVATRDLGRTGILDGSGYVAFDAPDPTATVAVGLTSPLSGLLTARIRFG